MKFLKKKRMDEIGSRKRKIRHEWHLGAGVYINYHKYPEKTLTFFYISQTTGQTGKKSKSAPFICAQCHGTPVFSNSIFTLIM